MSKKEYISLLPKKKPFVETATLRRWGSRAVMVLLAGSIFYREVLPKVQKFIK